MIVRIRAFFFVLCTAAFFCSAFAAGPDLHAPEHLPGDSLSQRSAERNRRFFDSLQSKSSRHAVPRLLYRTFFNRPVPDTTASGRVRDDSHAWDALRGRTVGRIDIERRQIFRSDGNWLRRTGNKAHVLTRERVIRRDLLFRSGERFDPQLVVRNMQLLRSRPYISDVDVDVRPDPLDSSRVDLVIRTRDRWTITLDGAWRSEGRTMVGIADADILGTGNLLRIETNFSRKDFSYGGNLVSYRIPNVLGTFYTADFAAGRNFYESTLDLQLHKEFLRPTDYEVGLSYSDLKFKRYMIAQDTSLLVKERNFDAWGGYSHYLTSISSSLYFTARYNYRRFLRRPADVAADRHPALHDRDLLLFGAGLYRERFLTANMIYGFGTREYLAAGYKAEIVGGRSWGEFGDEIYLGLDCRTGGFRSVGYIMGGIALGGYVDPRSGTWRRSALDVDLRWFSDLFLYRRNRIRQFLMFNYTQGWNRSRGNDEIVRFTRRDGLQALDQHVTGTARAVLDTETVVFTPWQPLGFRIAFFAFGDLGLIGYSPNIFRNDFFASLGGGLRIKNERLIFSTIQIRLGVAFCKNGLAGSGYFRLSNSTRLEQYRYLPSRPETIAFE